MYLRVHGGKCIRQVKIQRQTKTPEVCTNKFHTYGLRLHTRIRTFQVRNCLASPRRLARSSCRSSASATLVLRRAPPLVSATNYLPPPSQVFFASVIIKHAALCFLHFCLCIYYKQKKKIFLKNREKETSASLSSSSER